MIYNERYLFFNLLSNRIQLKENYRLDLENQEGCGVVAHERLTEQRVKIE